MTTNQYYWWLYEFTRCHRVCLYNVDISGQTKLMKVFHPTLFLFGDQWCFSNGVVSRVNANRVLILIIIQWLFITKDMRNKSLNKYYFIHRHICLSREIFSLFSAMIIRRESTWSTKHKNKWKIHQVYLSKQRQTWYSN